MRQIESNHQLFVMRIMCIDKSDDGQTASDVARLNSDKVAQLSKLGGGENSIFR